MDSIKIQINNVAALERLIGDDKSFEIMVKNSVIQEFTKRHLKGLVYDDLRSKVEKFSEEFLLCDNHGGSRYGKKIIKKEFQDKIKDEINTNVTIVIKECVSEVKENQLDSLETKIDYYMRQAIHPIVKEIFRDLFNDEMKKNIEKIARESIHSVLNEGAE